MARMKKFVALLLCVLMFVQAMPMTALADELIATFSNVVEGNEPCVVTFNPDPDVTGDEFVQYVDPNGTPIAPEDPVKTGYKFNGWEPEIGAVTADTTYTGTWEKKISYTVTVHYLPVALKDKAYTETDKLAPDAVRSYAADETEPVSIKSPIIEMDADVILYPDQSAIEFVPKDLGGDKEYFVYYDTPNATYKVLHRFQPVGAADDAYTSFVALEGYADEDQPLNDTVVGATVAGSSLETVPAGFTFHHVTSAKVEGEEGTVVYAYYTRNTNYIIFESNGGTPLNSLSKKYGEEIELPGELASGATADANKQYISRVGYTFNGWYTNEECTDKFDGTTMPADAQTTLYAGWTAKEVSYKVVYWLEKDNLGAGVTPSPVQDGVIDFSQYEYFGSETRTETADTTVYPTSADQRKTFTANQVNGATGDGSSHVVAEYQDCSGLTVDGVRVDSVVVKGDGSSVLNVFYKRKVFTFSFSFSNYSFRFTGETDYRSSYSYKVKYEDDISTTWPSSFNTEWKSGNNSYNFYGWSSNSHSSSTYVSHRWTVTPDMLNEDGGSTTTFTRSYTPDGVDTYTVKYWVEAIPGEDTSIYKVSIKDYTGDTETTYGTTEYWLHKASQTLRTTYNLGPKKLEGFTPPSGSFSTSNNTIQFRYSRNKYALTFEENGGTAAVEDQTAVPFEKLLKTYKPSAYVEGETTKVLNGITYEFTGWYYESDCVTKVDWDADRMPAKALELFAGWTPKKTSVTVHYNNEKDADVTIELSVGEKIAEQEKFNKAPTRLGYKLAGWTTDSEGENMYSPSSSVTEAVTDIYAKWEKTTTSYTVRYVHESDLTVDLLEPVVVDGVEWSLEDDEEAPWIIVEYEAIPNMRPKTIYQKFVPNPDPSLNEITFVYYDWVALPYHVHYGYTKADGSWADLISPKDVEDSNAERVVEYPVDLSAQNYYPVDVYQTLELSMTEADNHIYFEYLPYKTVPYEVHYFKDNVEVEAEMVDDVCRIGYTIPVDKKEFVGYYLDSVDPGLYVTPDENDSETIVINLYYKIRTDLSYTVNYYWNGTTEKVAESKIVGAQTYNTVVTESPKTDITGYTPVSTAAQTITIGVGENVINFYYYKNVTLTANSDKKTYNGSEQSVSGYTDDVADVDPIFNGVSASGSGTNVGEYNVTFSEGALTTVDTTAKYIVTEAKSGTLTITQKDARVASADLSKAYDGTALTNGETPLTVEGFVEGEGVVPTFTGSQTVVGSSANAFTYAAQEGTDLNNYNITKTEGTLTVTAMANAVTVTIKENSGSATFDGTEKTVTGYEIDSISSKLYTENDFSFSGDATVKGTNAGTYNMELKPSDFTNNNANFGNVVFVIKDGTLVIDPARVTVTADDKTKVYGEADPELTATVTGLVGNDTVEYKLTRAAGEDVGDYTITASGDAEQGNYVVTYEPGTLTITSKTTEIVVTANSNTKVYDGDALTDAGYTYDESQLVAGDIIEAVVVGSQTNVGKAENVVESYKVMRGETDVTDNYSGITTKDGTLTVTKRPVTLTSADDEKVYDGKALTNDTVTVGGDKFVDGEGATYTVTGSQTEVGESKNTFTYTLNENTKADNYTIKTTEGTLKVTALTDKVTVTITENSGEYTYDGTEKTVTGYTVDISNKLYTEDDFTFSGEAVVKGTEAGTYNMELKPEHFTNNSKNITNVEFVIVDGQLVINPNPVEIVITAGSAEKVYDGTELTQAAYTYTGELANGDELVATTKGTITNVGTAANVIDTYAILDENGNDVTKSYSGITTVEGELKITKRPVTITADSASKEYDGTALTKDSYTNSDNLADGQTIASVTVTGSQTMVGSSANVPSDAVIKSGETDVTANYDITYVNGTLTVSQTSKALQIESASKIWMYDGAAHTNPEYVVTFGGETIAQTDGKWTLPTGDVVEITMSESATVTNVEDSAAEKNTFTYTLTNAEQYADVSVKYGDLTITERKVVMTSASDEKEYDGNALTNDTVTVTGDGFVEGEGAAYTVTGTQTLVGSSENKFTYELNENTLAGNYDITVVFGTLTVKDRTNPYEIEVVANSGEFKYDGEAKTVEGFKTLTFVVEDNTYTVEGLSAKTTETNAGEYVVAITGTEIVRDENGNDVTAQFAVTKTNGRLTITKRELTMTSADDSKTYDATALTNDTVTVSGEGFVEGEGAAYDVTGSQTLVGESDNTFTYTLNEGTLADNYTIKTVFGTLTVTDEGVDHSLVINKTHPDGEYDLGDLVTFTITVKNIYAEAKTIEITEIEGVTITGESVFENVAPGAVVETTATWNVTEEAILAGEFVNTATATVGGKQYSAQDTVKPVAPNGHLTADKITTSKPANGESYALGETISYKITVTNDGNLTVKNVQVIDALVGLNETIEVMLPGDVKTFDVTYTVTEEDILAGSVKNEVTVKGNGSDGKDPEGGDDVVDPTDKPNPHLTVVKTTTSKPANGKDYVLGEKIEYSITVTNDGNLTISNVVVTDEFTGDTWTVESMAPGAVETFTTSHVVNETDILAGSVKNVATAAGDNKSDVPTEVIPGETEDPTEDKNGHLTVDKITTSTPAEGDTYALGETITYKITVTNDGNLTITDITVTDELTGDEWTIESLIPGTSKEFTAEYTVTEKDILNGKVVNVATAKGTSPDPDQPDVPVVPGEKEEETDDINVALNVTKTSDATEMTGLGDTITYTITVKNEGNVPYTNLVVDDQLDGVQIQSSEAYTIDENGDAVIAELAVGETVVITATYVVTEADLVVETEGNPVITNKVVVEGDPIPNPKDETEVVPGGEAEVEDEILPYTLTVNYWFDEVGGEIAAPTVVEQHFNGQTYLVVSPEIEHYTVSLTEVTGVMNGDITVDVVYSKIYHRLLINYVFENGKTAAPSYKKYVHEGAKYSVTSPYVEGFTANIQVVSGTMPGRNLVITVTYVPDMYDVPMNIGNTTMNCGECFE